MNSYGWFKFEKDPIRIINRSTGQFLEVESIDLNKTENTISRRVIAKYEDSDFSKHVEFHINKNKYENVVIVLNYNTLPETPFPYSKWRRFDDFISDALLCWPEYINSKNYLYLKIEGAWISGEWNPYILREISGDRPHKYKDKQQDNIEDLTLKGLADTEYKSWSLDKSNQFDLSQLKNPKPIEKGRNIFSPFLKREDGKAFIVFEKIKSHCHMAEFPQTLLYYTYIDDEVFFTFRTTPNSGIESGSVNNYGIRKTQLRVDLLPRGLRGEIKNTEVQSKLRCSYLSYSLWLNIKQVIDDAWRAWGDGIEVIVDDAENVHPLCGTIGKVGDYGNAISCGYVAGMLNLRYKIRYKEI